MNIDPAHVGRAHLSGESARDPSAQPSAHHAALPVVAHTGARRARVLASTGEGWVVLAQALASLMPAGIPRRDAALEAIRHRPTRPVTSDRQPVWMVTTTSSPPHPAAKWT